MPRYSAAHRASAAALLLRHVRSLSLGERRRRAALAGRGSCRAKGQRVYSDEVLARLRGGPINVGDVAEELELTPHQVRQAVQQLRRVGHAVVRVGVGTYALVQERD